MEIVLDYLSKKRSEIHKELEIINRAIIEEERRGDEYREVPELTTSQKAKVKVLAKHHFLGGQVEVLDEILELLNEKLQKQE